MRRSAQSTAAHFGRRLRAAGLDAAIAGLAALPATTAEAVGLRLGRGFARLDTRAHRIARANLELAFPDLAAIERERLLHEHWRHFARAAVAWSRLPRTPASALRGRVEVDGLERLQRALAAGRGALVATAHFGFWELVLPALRERLPGVTVNAVARGQRNPALNRHIERRRRIGGGPSPLAQDAREILRALARGEAIGVLADHALPERRGGRPAPFFGYRVWTNPGPATVALRAGCALLPAHIRPLGDGRERILIGAEIAPPPGSRSLAVAAMTARLNAEIENWIRDRPELWLWSHARFRHSPDLDADAYERAARRDRGRRPRRAGAVRGRKAPPPSRFDGDDG